MSLPAGMIAAAEGPSLLLFFAIQVQLPAVGALPAKTLCLLDGSATIAWGGHTFVGADGDYGTWGGMEPIVEQIAVQSPSFKTTFYAISDNAVQQLCSPTAQGSPVTIWYGYLNPTTGQPVTTPVVLWNGLLDKGQIIVAQNAKHVDISVVSTFELLFLNNDGATLCTAWHQQFFPGELGFEFIDNVTHEIPWGNSGPRPDQVTNKDNYDVGPGLPSTTLKF